MRYEIVPDHGPHECPTEWSEWEPVSFCTRHINFADPESVGILGVDQYGDARSTVGLQRKLDCNTAFILSYYEHGLCDWFLKGHGLPGSDCRWDGTRIAGVLRWNGKAKDCGKTLEDREKHAKGFIESYTQWCNGDIWGYRILNDEDEEMESCYGLFGYDSAEEEAKSVMEHLQEESLVS